MNKKVLIPTLGLAALVVAGILGVSAVRADENGTYPPMIESLVERFGLNEDEVKTFFDEQRQERQRQMEQAREERLNQAVADGVITEEQKQALQGKWEEMRTKREQHREEMRQWMEDSGIDFEKLAGYGVGCGGRGFSKGGRGWKMGGF